MYPQRCLALLHPILAKTEIETYKEQQQQKILTYKKRKTLRSFEEQHYLQTLKISNKVTTAFLIQFSYVITK